MKRKFWLLPMNIVAIGSGQAATAKDAQEVCLLIRNKLEKLFSADIARKVRVLYGGQRLMLKMPQILQSAVSTEFL